MKYPHLWDSKTRQSFYIGPGMGCLFNGLLLLLFALLMVFASVILPYLLSNSK